MGARAVCVLVAALLPLSSASIFGNFTNDEGC